MKSTCVLTKGNSGDRSVSGQNITLSIIGRHRSSAHALRISKSFDSRGPGPCFIYKVPHWISYKDVHIFIQLYTSQTALPHFFYKDNKFLRLKLMGWDTKNFNIHISYGFIFFWHLGHISEKMFIVPKWRHKHWRGKVRCYSSQRLIWSTITFRAFVTNRNIWGKKYVISILKSYGTPICQLLICMHFLTAL